MPLDHSGYSAKASGLLIGSGGPGSPYRARKQRRYNPGRLPRYRLSDRTRLKCLPDFDPQLRYSDYDLQLLAEKILMDDPKPPNEEPVILLASHLRERSKREVYVASGTPSPHIVRGLYNRTHPNGRKVSSNHQRKAKAASFYR